MTAEDDAAWDASEQEWSRKVADALPIFYGDETGQEAHKLVHEWFHEIEDGTGAWALIMALVAMATFPVKRLMPEGAEMHAGIRAFTLDGDGVSDLPEDSLILAALRVVSAALNEDFDMCNAIVDTVFLRGDDAFEDFMMHLGSVAWSMVQSGKEHGG